MYVLSIFWWMPWHQWNWTKISLLTKKNVFHLISGDVDSLFPGTWYLDYVDEKHRRNYKKTLSILQHSDQNGFVKDVNGLIEDKNGLVEKWSRSVEGKSGFVKDVNGLVEKTIQWGLEYRTLDYWTLEYQTHCNTVHFEVQISNGWPLEWSPPFQNWTMGNSNKKASILFKTEHHWAAVIPHWK